MEVCDEIVKERINEGKNFSPCCLADRSIFNALRDFSGGGVLTVHAANTVNLANLTANYEAKNGDVLTGVLAGDYRIFVANGAIITLRNATIAPPTNSVTQHAGISCLGDATIYIEGDNTDAFSFHPVICQHQSISYRFLT